MLEERELERVGGTRTLDATNRDLPAEIARGRFRDDLYGYHDGVAAAKRALINEALRRTGGHQTKAAELLGLTQPYLARGW